jgi:hypothetical protein
MLERLRGEPFDAPGIEELEEKTRLTMGALLFNDEFDAAEKKAMKVFKSPLDMAMWLTAGADRWGVDPKFAPMRAFDRAVFLRRFLGGDKELRASRHDYSGVGVVGELEAMAPERAQAGRAWSSSLPTSASAVLLRRRHVPLQAVAGHALRHAVPYGFLGMATWAVAQGQIFLGVLATVGAGVSKMVDLARSDLDKERPRVELWPARESLASNARLEKLRSKALERAQELGGKQPSVQEQPTASREKAQSLRQEARALKAQAKKALAGTVLESLANASKAKELLGQAQKASSEAQNIESELRNVQKQGPRDQSRAASRALAEFSSLIRWEATASMGNLSDLRDKTTAALDREQVSQSSRDANPKIDEQKPRKPSARL